MGWSGYHASACSFCKSKAKREAEAWDLPTDPKCLIIHKGTAAAAHQACVERQGGATEGAIKGIEVLAGEEEREIMCCICLDVLYNPMLIQCGNEHFMCAHCLKQYNQDKCPECKVNFTQATKKGSRRLRGQIERFLERYPSKQRPKEQIAELDEIGRQIGDIFHVSSQKEAGAKGDDSKGYNEDDDFKLQFVVESSLVEMPTDARLACNFVNVYDQDGEVRVRVPRQSLSSIRTEALSAKIIAVTPDMQSAAARRTNLLLGRESVCILIGGDVIHFEPSGTTFAGQDVAWLSLPVDKGLAAGLQDLNVPFSVGVFRWNTKAQIWHEISRISPENALDGVAAAPTESFSSYVAAFYVVAGALALSGMTAVAAGVKRKTKACFAAVGPENAPRKGSPAIFRVLVYSPECQAQVDEGLDGEKVYKKKEGMALEHREEPPYHINLEMFPQSTSAHLFHCQPSTDSFRWVAQMGILPECSMVIDRKAELPLDHEPLFVMNARVDGFPDPVVFKPLRLKLGTDSEGRYSQQQVCAGVPTAAEMPAMVEAIPMRPSDVPWELNVARGGVGDAAQRWRVVFFPCRVGTNINPAQEGQELKDRLSSSDGKFTVDSHLQPQVKHFTDEMEEALRKHLKGEIMSLILHFAGHCDDEGGLYWYSEAGMKVQVNQVTGKRIARLIQACDSGGELLRLIDLFFMNACLTLSVGLELHWIGVRNVVCWKNGVKDSVATAFALRFYEFVNAHPGLYARAFEVVCLEQSSQFEGARPCLLRSGAEVGDGGAGRAEMWDGKKEQMVPVPDDQQRGGAGRVEEVEGATGDTPREVAEGGAGGAGVGKGEAAATPEGPRGQEKASASAGQGAEAATAKPDQPGAEKEAAAPVLSKPSQKELAEKHLAAYH